MIAEPDTRVDVVSPHLDDAVLSLGAAIHQAARHGVRVRVVTALAGDPDAPGELSDWERRCGLSSAEEALHRRRAEDAEACSIVGAEPVWLPLNEGAGTAELQAALADALAGADALLVPGFPLAHLHHGLVAGAALASGITARIGFYVEQPYAMWRLLGAPPEEGSRMRNALRLAARRGPRLPATLPMQPVAVSAADARAKRRAVRAYASQLPVLGRQLVERIAFYEWGMRGEAVGWRE